MKTKATTRPWRVIDAPNDGKYIMKDHVAIAEVLPITRNFGVETNANGEFIIKAVNLHDDLIKLLDDLEAWFEGESFEYSEEISKLLAKAKKK